MHAGSDSLSTQARLDTIAVRRPHDIEMEYVAGPMPSHRRGKRGAIQRRVIDRCDTLPSCILLIEMSQLHAQDRCLDLIETAVHTDFVAKVVRTPAILAQRGDMRSELVRCGGDQAAVSERAKVLGG